MPTITLNLYTKDGPVPVEVPDQTALFILGRNGTGKSALVHNIQQGCRNQHLPVVYLPGSRPTYFDSDSLNMTPLTRTQFESNTAGWDSNFDIRTRPISGTTRNERAIYDLQSAQMQYMMDAALEIKREGAGSEAIYRLQSDNAPLDRVNRLLTQANLPVQVLVEKGELRATRDGAVYSISKMSDGERTALIFIADVIAAKTGSVFIVDEPELHLHRSIVVPLLTALMAERPDCTTVVSTHELALPNEHPDSPIVIVRGCTWQGVVPTQWDVELLPNSNFLPDDLRTDLLGSRQKILFVEGDAASRDLPLYAILFPSSSIRHRSSCLDVRRAVLGLKETMSSHHAEAFGLVDNDGMSLEFQQKLLENNVYALPVFSVESLYYAEEVLRTVAEIQGRTLGEDPSELYRNAFDSALNMLGQSGKIEHLAALVAERQMRDKVLSAMPSRDAMIASGDAPLRMDIHSPYPATLERIRALRDRRDLDAIVMGFNVRQSGILGAIAKSLKFSNETYYEKAARTAIGLNEGLQDVLRSKLGPLAQRL